MAITTAEQLLRASDIGRCELIRGELRMMVPPGFEHGRIAVNVTLALGHHVKAHGLGTVLGETGFLLARSPDTVRAPDVAFVRSAGPQRGYFPGAPDLAVEVLSPNDRPVEVREKIAEWLDAGTIAVWVVDPRNRVVTVHESGCDPSVFEETDVVPGGPLLPGFSLAVREIFA